MPPVNQSFLSLGNGIFMLSLLFYSCKTEITILDHLHSKAVTLAVENVMWVLSRIIIDGIRIFLTHENNNNKKEMVIFFKIPLAWQEFPSVLDTGIALVSRSWQRWKGAVLLPGLEEEHLNNICRQHLFPTHFTLFWKVASSK